MYSLVLCMVISAVSLSQSLVSGSISLKTSGNLHSPVGPNCKKNSNYLKPVPNSLTLTGMGNESADKHILIILTLSLPRSES